MTKNAIALLTFLADNEMDFDEVAEPEELDFDFNAELCETLGFSLSEFDNAVKELTEIRLVFIPSN